MPLDTAAGLLVLSLGSLVLVTRRFPREAAAIPGLLVVLLGFLVLIEWASGWSLSISPMFTEPSVPELAGFGGRVAASTAIAFCFAGFALLAGGLVRSPWAWLGCLSLVPLAFGISSALATALAAPDPIALPEYFQAMLSGGSAAAFTLWGTATAILAWGLEPRRVSGVPPWTPAFGAIGAVAILFGLDVVLSSRAALSPLTTAIVYIAFGTAAWTAGTRRLSELAVVSELEESEAALRESEARFRAFMDHTPAIAFLKDADGRYVYINAGLERIFGYPREKVIGQTDSVWLPQDDAKRISETDRLVLESGEPVQATYAVPGSDGDIHTWMTWKFRVENRGHQQIGGLSVDITDRVRNEAELDHRARQLEAANRELLEADRYKDEFLSVLSHELRTPLNFITGFASIIEDGLAGPVTSQQLQYLSQIQEGADRMLRLVQDMLDFARIRAGKLTLIPTEIDLAELVDLTMEALYPLAQAAGVVLEADVHVERLVTADEGRVVQVLSNLLSNAFKFSPAGGTVCIKAYEQGERVIVEVRDIGPGISQEDLEKLFKRFRQLDMSTTRTTSGVGLGLAICKGIVEAHGGGIGVRSEPQAGSTFWFWLPLAGAASLHSQAGSPPRPPSSEGEIGP